MNTDSIAEEVEAKAADLYVVRLKEGVMFRDGKPVTADDMIYSFNRMLDPDLAVFGGSALRPILDPSGLTKIDDRTVQIQLKQLVSNFKENLCAYTCCIVPDGYERFAGDPTNQIGTGPYKLQEFEVGVQSIHVRNENYWDTGKPYFDEVHIIDFADGDAMINALVADQIDCAGDIPSTAVDVLNGTDGYKVLNAAGGGWLTISWRSIRNRSPTCASVRRCVSIVDRQAMVDQVLGGYGRIANDLYSPLDAVYLGDDLPQREQDIAAAMALLEEAGMADLEIDLFAPNDTAGLPEMVQAFSTMAAEAGITVNAGRARRRHVLGRRVPEAHVRGRLLGHPELPRPGRREQLADGAVPRRPLAAGGLDLHRRLQRRPRRGRRRQAQGHHRQDADRALRGGRVDHPVLPEPARRLQRAGAGSGRAGQHAQPRPLRPRLQEPLLLGVEPFGGFESMSNNWGVVRFIGRRVLLGLLTLFIVSIIVFAATQVLPSDPATAILGRDATPASVAALRAELGLDRPAVTQYADWLGGILTGDPGESFNARQPILDYIGSRVTNSLFLLVLASVISIPLGLLIGAVQAGRRDTVFDEVSSFTMLGLASIPEFVIGMTLVIVFSTRVWHGLPAVTQIGTDRPWQHLDQMILPTATLVLGAVPYISRITRASLIEVMESDYVEMARLKGAPERTVMWRHAMPNSLGPVFQVIALNIAYFAGGVIVVEYLFNYPGIGGALQASVRVRDIPVIQFLVMVLAAVYVCTNLVADVATILVTPRLRTRVS